jgi:hypothetical protein
MRDVEVSDAGESLDGVTTEFGFPLVEQLEFSVIILP